MHDTGKISQTLGEKEEEDIYTKYTHTTQAAAAAATLL